MRKKGRRAGDKGWTCLVALRFSQFWDFIDARDIDKHAMAWAIFAMTCYITKWALDFYWIYPDKSGLELAAVFAAIFAPWSTVQLLVIKYYFETITGKAKETI